MDIQGYENLYIIYQDGRIYTKYKKEPLKYYITKKGYYQLTLCHNYKKQSFLLHRLIAIHYIPNPNNYEQVDHIDRDRRNNRISNLRWVNNSMNQQNTVKRINNKSGVKNIHQTNTGSWCYCKRINGVKLQKTLKSKPLLCWVKFVYELSRR